MAPDITTCPQSVWQTSRSKNALDFPFFRASFNHARMPWQSPIRLFKCGRRIPARNGQKRHLFSRWPGLTDVNYAKTHKRQKEAPWWAEILLKS